MAYITEVILLKRKILTLLCKELFNGTLKNEIRNIAQKIIDLNAKPFRCCEHHDKAITNDRIKMILGINAEKNKNISWNDVISKFEHLTETDTNELDVINVMPDACNGCPQKRYYITEACQHCLAHPCVLNCPKKVITIQNNKAVIDNENCIECGKCIKVCPFNAIIHVNRPCEQSCPVNAIYTDEKGIAVIDESKCIYCGKCIVSCPFGAIVDRTDILKVIHHLSNGKKLTALIAPSAVAQFSPKSTIKQLCAALKLLGFNKVYELAYHADLVAQEEAKELKHKKSNNEKLTSSCCPSWVSFLNKSNHTFKNNISHSLSPMLKAGESKTENEKMVFIGPCISKKKEAENTAIDFVLTYEELACMFAAKNIDVLSCAEMSLDIEGGTSGRFFAKSSGVTAAIKQYIDFECSTDLINGIDKSTFKNLKSFENTDFIEGMACENGCIGGPCVITNPLVTLKILDKLLS